MRKPSYYTLISSLPKLDYFQSAKVLPINGVRLDQRLSLLCPEDGEQLSRARTLLEWQYQITSRTEIGVCCDYHETLQSISNTCLRQFVRFRINLRMVMSVLRKQLAYLHDEAKQSWATEQLNSSIQQLMSYHDDSDKLTYLFPWLNTATTYLEQQRSVDLERLLMQLVWRYADTIREQHLFLFESVFAYVFQWDILARWLSYQSAPAQQRFIELEKEVTRGYC